MNKPENSTGIGLLIYAAEKAVLGKTEMAKETPQAPQTTVEKKEDRYYGDEETEVVIEPFTAKFKKYFKKLF